MTINTEFFEIEIKSDASAIVSATTYFSLFSLLTKISEYLQEVQFEGMVIFDDTFSKGLSDRFYEGEFVNGKFDMRKFLLVYNTALASARNQWLIEHKDKLDESALSNYEKYLVNTWS